jgi:hypothetical protein
MKAPKTKHQAPEKLQTESLKPGQVLFGKSQNAVPKGQLKIAQRFNAGSPIARRQVPKGRLKGDCSYVQSSLRDSNGIDSVPGVETAYVVSVAAGFQPAVEPGILPGGLYRGLRSQFRVQSYHSGRQDAALYGSQDGCRYSRKPTLLRYTNASSSNHAYFVSVRLSRYETPGYSRDVPPGHRTSNCRNAIETGCVCSAVWKLVFGSSLELGAWDLELSPGGRHV